MQDRRVDLVRMGPFLNLLYREDMAHRDLADADKEQPLSALEQHAVTWSPEDANTFLASWRREGGDVLKLLVASFAVHCGQADFVDVGCQYGNLSMNMTLFIRSLALNVNVYAFDCGISRGLAACNFANNGFADDIRFYPLAVGAMNGFVAVHRNLGHSEGNRIGAALSGWEYGSTDEVVRCLTLDSLAEIGRPDRATILKIDTEGGEQAVLRGASRIVNHSPCALMIEFTPAAFRNPDGRSSATGFPARA